jgi:hypothetical protein
MMTRALGDGTSNLERLASWKKYILLGAWKFDEDLNRVIKAFVRSPKKSISRVSADLKMPETNVHKILRKSPRLTPHKLQVVQKLTARDKGLRSQFAGQCPQILEHDHFEIILSTLTRKNFTSLDVSVVITVMWGSESLENI